MAMVQIHWQTVFHTVNIDSPVLGWRNSSRFRRSKADLMFARHHANRLVEYISGAGRFMSAMSNIDMRNGRLE